MPSNADFSFRIEVGGVTLPEYEKEGKVYVESSLSTPYSYRMKQEEIVDGEVESQEWPVTPYKLSITTHGSSSASHLGYNVFVDGVMVKRFHQQPGRKVIIDGFTDGQNVREFLFSLPRFARDEVDRLETGRQGKVGSIEVECCNLYKAVHKYTRHPKDHQLLGFRQANKKDCNKVTNGKFLMATTKAGRVIKTKKKEESGVYLPFLRNTLSVRYHMAHSLQDMGIKLAPSPFSQSNSTVQTPDSFMSAGTPLTHTPHAGDPIALPVALSNSTLPNMSKSTTHTPHTRTTDSSIQTPDAVDSATAQTPHTDGSTVPTASKRKRKSGKPRRSRKKKRKLQTNHETRESMPGLVTQPSHVSKNDEEAANVPATSAPVPMVKRELVDVKPEFGKVPKSEPSAQVTSMTSLGASAVKTESVNAKRNKPVNCFIDLTNFDLPSPNEVIVLD